MTPVLATLVLFSAVTADGSPTPPDSKPAPVTAPQAPATPTTTTSQPAQTQKETAQPAAQAAAPAPAPPQFIVPNTVAETNRLALTPKLDGKLGTEEWDPLTTGDINSFFQWEPGKLYFAGRVMQGQDALISLDLKGSGWLVGGGKYEIRLTVKDGKITPIVRQLDTMTVNGPQWVETTQLANQIDVVGSSEGKEWVFEMSVYDGSLDVLPKGPARIGVRVDSVPNKQPQAEPYLPRTMATLNLTFDRQEGLPAGLNWRPLGSLRSVVPGEDFRIRHTFQSSDEVDVKRYEIRAEGDLRDATTSIGSPFPGFDKKGRSYLDYSTRVSRDATQGYRIIRTTIVTGDGVPAVIENSLRVSPLVDVTISRDEVPSSAEKKHVRFGVYVKSNTVHRVDGILMLKAPDNWRVLGGTSSRNFIIYDPRGAVRRVFDVEIPAATNGVFPLEFTADIGGQVSKQTIWFTVKK
ncbi:MAG: hypothetical protein JSS72_10370 [Armatimonadetes bacterium]|nr:hypothetical protein [Armatimonadota bacterium]